MDRIAATGLGVGFTFMLATAVQAAEPLLTEVIDRRAAAYRGNPLKDGTLAYTDRRFPLEAVPTALVGATYLRFPNDAKGDRVGGAVFTLERPATVYLCYDGRAREWPDWIQAMGFERTELTMTVGAAGAYPFHLFRRDFPAGRVLLGPNLNEAGGGGGCMYGVALKAKAEGEGPLVSAVGYHRGADFHGVRFEDGARVYTDRAFTLKGVPPDLAGAVYVPTPMGLRASREAGVSLVLSAKATLYVGFTGAVPGWAAKMGLEKTNLAVTVTGLDRSPAFRIDLWRGEAGPGRVDLGPNAADDDGNMYVVILSGTKEQNAVGVASGVPAKRPEPVRPDNPKIVWCDDVDRWTGSVWAGNPTLGPQFQQGPLLEASAPGRLVFAPDGMVYAVVGSALAVIRDGRMRLFAGVPGVVGHADGPIQRALFGEIGAIDLDHRGGLIVFDEGNLCFRRVAQTDGAWTVTTVAGVPGEQGLRDGPAGQALFDRPWNLAVDSAGRIFTFDGNFLRRIADGTVTTLNPKGGSGWQDGPLETARFSISPGGGCSIDEHDILFLADRINRCIRRIDLAKGEVTTVCGSPIQHQLGYTDGPAPLVAFHDSPGYILYDPVRKCYYTNGVDEACIRRLEGGWLKSLAGHGKALTGPAKDLNMMWPAVIGIDRVGDLYIHDGAHRGLVRKLTYTGDDKRPAPAVTPPEVRPPMKSGDRMPDVRPGPGENRPMLSPDFNERFPAVAYGGGRFLMVFQRGWSGLGGQSDIAGAFVDVTAGTAKRGAVFRIAGGTGVCERPAVAGSKAGFLVAWQELGETGGAAIRAARVSGDGKVLDVTPLTIAAGEGSHLNPAVASDGEGYLIAWQAAVGGAPYAIQAVRLSADGTVRDGNPLQLGRGCTPAVAFGGGRYLVVWDAGAGRSATVEGALVPFETKKGSHPVTSGGLAPFSIMQVCTHLPSVAAGTKGFLVVASRQPAPNPWGWGGTSGFVCARVGFDGSTPDAAVTYGYYHRDLAARTVANVIDSGQWKREPHNWPAGRVGGFPGTENDQWPHLYSAVAPSGLPAVPAQVGEGFAVVWVRRRLRNRWELVGSDLFGTTVAAEPLKVARQGGTPVAPTDVLGDHAAATRPRLAAGAGVVLLVWERVGRQGGIQAAALPLQVP